MRASEISHLPYREKGYLLTPRKCCRVCEKQRARGFVSAILGMYVECCAACFRILGVD